MKPFLFTLLFLVLTAQGKDQPNVLFIAVDDLRDWVGHFAHTGANGDPPPVTRQIVEILCG